MMKRSRLNEESKIMGGGSKSKRTTKRTRVQTDNHVTRIIQGHAMPIRDINRGRKKEHYLEDQNIINKEFGEVIKSQASTKHTTASQAHETQPTATWTNR